MKDYEKLIWKLWCNLFYIHDYYRYMVPNEKNIEEAIMGEFFEKVEL